jgi:hypothetical protein
MRKSDPVNARRLLKTWESRPRKQEKSDARAHYDLSATAHVVSSFSLDLKRNAVSESP